MSDKPWSLGGNVSASPARPGGPDVNCLCRRGRRAAAAVNRKFGGVKSRGFSDPRHRSLRAAAGAVWFRLSRRSQRRGPATSMTGTARSGPTAISPHPTMTIIAAGSLSSP